MIPAPAEAVDQRLPNASPLDGLAVEVEGAEEKLGFAEMVGRGVVAGEGVGVGAGTEV